MRVENAGSTLAELLAYARSLADRRIESSSGGFHGVIQDELNGSEPQAGAAAAVSPFAAPRAEAGEVLPFPPSQDPGQAAAVPPIPARPGTSANTTPGDTTTVNQGESGSPSRIPTPEEIFGENPFVENPQGQFTDAYSGQLRTYGFRSMYFATEKAALKIAEQLGGTVVQRSAIVDAGFFTQVQPNQMILLPNGRELNAGIIADFYNHGYSQSYIDRLIANEINPDGGYGNLATPVTIVRNGIVQPGAISPATST
jgi:hypothetical protein